MQIVFGRLAVAAAVLSLAACGGGSDSAAPSTAPVVTTTALSTTVIDGALKNATVCLDKNGNGACDAGEPSGKTDASGNVTIQVDNADVGKYPILAVVGTDAIDADTGAVPVPFTLKAPADKTGVVSPLTTLVQTLIASTGTSSANAEASIKAQTGLNVSLFEDFTKGTSADSQVAGTVARMVVVTTQQQSSTLGSTVGKNALDGTVIKQTDLDKIIQNRLLEILPSLLTALTDPTVQAATTPAAKEAALLAQAQALVASPSTGLTTTSVATLVAINNQIAAPATAATEAPAASANLRSLNFANSANWSSRVIAATAAENTPDAAGKVRYVVRRNNSVNSAVAAWNYGGNPSRQSDMHFNGSSWVSCAVNGEGTNTVRDAKGNMTYNDCDNLETGSSNRAAFDIAGRTMIDVYNQIKTAGYTNLSISSATSALGTVTFPADSKLFYQTNTPLSTAVAYYPGSSNYVTQYSAAVSAGGVASTQGVGVGCNSTEFKNTNGANSTTLEGMIGAMTGTPCIFPQGSFTYNTVTYVSPDPVDEAWGNSTVGLGNLGTAPVGTGATAPGFYSGNTRLRVAFKGTGTNPVTYYSCKERFNNGSPRNCTAIGTGSYSISTLGDARIMTLSSPPLIASGLGYQRVFVERAGKIYLGYQNSTTTTNTARLNLVATNALFTQLGLPTVNPDTPMALTKTSYAGDWLVSDTAGAPGVTTFSIAANGNVSCSWTDGTTTDPVHACTLTFSNPGTGAFSMVDGVSTVTGTMNFLTGAASGTYNDPTSTPATGSFAGARR
jgi:hypothetical protein